LPDTITQVGIRLDKNAFMRACREGGDAIEMALRALDRSYFAVLFRDSMKVLREPEAARDLVQETFIKVWRRCATFRAQSELLPWIRAILRHALLDRLRRTEPEVPIEADAEVSEQIEQRIAELSAEQVAKPDDEERRRQLAECFARCWRSFETSSPAHAAVMSWIVQDGLNNEEIAQLLGRSPGATREFISQCRKRARRHFVEWYELAFGAS
jgi:RNA polymerase sigma-70 factor (ECF subfamily)